MEPKQVTLTLQTNLGESTIAGKAIALPTTRQFPPPIGMRFEKGYSTSGADIWDVNEFTVTSASLTVNDQAAVEIPSARGSCLTNTEQGVVNVRLNLNEPPKQPIRF
ncbi:contact site B protein [Cavenderia fasciculata]|uniref:Contact site B protein n=1 Tax=Cavenderia fasciculata TaxID=261658 RepID=F4PRB4_CACFS|nr:contact site B protein [Cavenderia fasciculata]EGG21314.1 contact site B protein [Cavenderia fasciculata]|eukprot:XP_004359164.1 contact site B protein [Cavenderia fasciculata]